MLKTNLTGVIYSISVSNLLFETIWITIRVDDRKQPSSLTFYKFQNTEFEKKKSRKKFRNRLNLELNVTISNIYSKHSLDINLLIFVLIGNRGTIELYRERLVIGEINRK